MERTVEDHIKGCERCTRAKAAGERSPLEPIYVTYPLELVHIDYLKLDPCKGNIEDVLVITDHFTRYAQAYWCKNQNAQTVARKLWENFVLHYGFPTTILSDQGKQFDGRVIAGWCRMAGCLLYTSPSPRDS